MAGSETLSVDGVGAGSLLMRNIGTSPVITPANIASPNPEARQVLIKIGDEGGRPDRRSQEALVAAVSNATGRSAATSPLSSVRPVVEPRPSWRK